MQSNTFEKTIGKVLKNKQSSIVGPSRRLMERLEDRILFDAVPDAPLDMDPLGITDPFLPIDSGNVVEEPLDNAGQTTEQLDPVDLVFIDKRVDDYELLVAELVVDRNTEVYFLDRYADGVEQIEQIVQIVEERNDVVAIHLIVPSEPGELYLGNTVVDLESLETQYADSFLSIGDGLSEDANLFIYNSDFDQGEAGAETLDLLETLTGADVATTSSFSMLAVPIANDQSYAISEDVNAIGNVLSNDSDPDGDTLTVIDIDGMATFGWDSPAYYIASGALVSILPDGNFSYSANNAFQLGDGDTVIDSFVYTISDGNGGTDTATVTITITGVEDPPIAQNDFSVSVPNGSLTGTVQTAGVPTGWQATNGTVDTANENGPYNYGVDWTLSPDGGTFVRAIDAGNETFTEKFGTQLIGLKPGDTYTLEFYQTNLGFYWAGGAEDRTAPGHFDIYLDDVQIAQSPTAAWPPGEVPSTHTNTWSELISITFTAPSTAPFLNIAAATEGSIVYLGIDGISLAGDGLIATDEDTPIAVDVLINDIDPDGDPLTITEVNGTPVVVSTPVVLPSGALLTLNPDDTFTYDPNGQYDPIGVGDTAVDTFTYTIDDGKGNTDTANVNIGINGLNDPVTATDNTADVTEDQVVPASGNVITDDDGFGIDSDIDNDPMSITFVNGTPIVGPTVIVGTYGTLTLDEDGSYDYVLDTANPAVAALLGGSTLNDTFNYTLSDGNGSTDTADLTVTITSMDDPPINSVPGDQFTGVDTPVVFSTGNGNAIATSDQDANGADIEATIAVVNGTLTLGDMTGLSFITGDGTDDPTITFTGTVDEINAALEGLTYTPTPGYNGTDTLTLTVDDLGNTGSGGPFSDVDTVDILVNDPPVVSTPIPDQNSDDNEAITPIDVSGNFDPVDGDPLTFTATNLPPGLSIDPVTGIISGTLDPSASTGGPYTIDITADDGNGATITDTFIYTVTNPVPVADDDVNTTSEDTPVVGSVIGNDSDPDGDTLTYSLDTDATNGMVVMNPDGSYIYTPDPDFNGVDTFIYLVDDGEGGTDTATVVITVTAENDPPVVIAPITDQAGVDNETITPIDVSGSFDDSADGDPLTFSATDLPPGLTIDPNTGIITGVIDSSASTTGPYTVVITADDGNGGTITDTFMYSVLNSVPVADDDVNTTPEDTPVVGTVAGNDSDSDGDPLTYTLDTDVTNGTVGLNPDGSYTYTPDPGFYGVDTFTYLVDDGEGGTDTATVTITVTEVQNPPVAVDDFEVPVPNGSLEGTAGQDTMPTGWQTIQGSPDIADANGPYNFWTPWTLSPDGGTFVRASAVSDGNTMNEHFGTQIDGLIPGNTYTVEFYQSNVGFGDATTPGHFDVKFDGVSIGQSPSAEWPPGENLTTHTNTWSDRISIPFTATAISQFLEFNPVTEGATASFLGIDGIRILGAGMTTTDEDTPIPVLDVLPNDYDLDGDPLTIIEVNGAAVSVGVPVALPSGALVTLNADGTFSYDPNGQFDSLDVGDTVLDPFTYTITDGNGGTDTATANIGILGLNDPPVVTPIDDVGDTDGNVITPIDVSTNFTDPEGNPLTFSATDLPPGLSIDPATGIISGTLGSSASTAGPYAVVITADDGNGGTMTDTFTYTVTNPAPAVFDDTNITSVDTPVVGTVAANDSDSDGDTLTYTLDTDPTNGSVVLNSDGSYTYTPDPGFIGVDTFTYLADDGEGGTDLASVTITILVGNPPIAVDDTLSMMEDVNGIGDVLINDSDPDGDPLTVIEIDGIPVSGTDSPSYYIASGALVSIRPDGSYSYSANDVYQLGAGETAVDSFDYVISDGNGNTSTATATITITGVEQPPVAVDDLSVTVLNGSLTGLVQIAAVPVGWQAIKGSPDMVAETGPYNNGVDWALSPDGGTFVRTVAMPDDNIFNEEFGTQLNNLIPGNTYTLEFYQTNLGFGYLNTPGHYNIELDGVEVAQSPSATWPPDTYNKTSENTWTPVSVSFTATETSHLLNIAAATEEASNAYLGIDGIKITGEGAFVTDEDTPIPVLDVLDNDFDPDGDPLTITEVNGVPISVGVSATLPSGATVTLNPGNTFSYDPNGQYEPLKVGESAHETFNYTITDGNGGTDTANVNIVILGLNDPVTAVDDVQYTLPGMPVNIDVLNNDNDPDNDPITVTGIIDPINTGIVIPISVGVPITLDSGTIVELQPDGTLDVTQPLGADGTETFEYKVSDGNGTTDTTTVTLIVDTDGDGVANADDIDDDNDGILDINEYHVGALTSITSQLFELSDLVPGTNYVGTDGQLWRNFADFTGGWSTVGSVDWSEGQYIMGSMGSSATDWPAVVEESPADGGFAIFSVPGESLRYTIPTTIGEEYTVSFYVGTLPTYFYISTGGAQNNYEPMLDWEIVSGGTLPGGSPAQFDLTDLPDQYTAADFPSALIDPATNGGNYTTLDPHWQFVELTFVATDVNAVLQLEQKSPTGFATSVTVVDGIEIGEVGDAFPFDSDSDGLADHLDIDKDNDGISDNVEAQSTALYIAPSGMPGAGFIDLDGDGLDDNYDANTADISTAASIGLIEIDTDSDGTVDSLDSDSDNDTVNDIAERGDGQPTSITSTVDTDLDGLLDIFEGVDTLDGFDVNDENLDAADTNFLLADSDSDTAADGSDAAPMLNDLDFRDNNLAPIGLDDAVTVIEDTTVTGNVLTNDTDPDGDPITVTDALVDTNGDGTPDPLTIGTPTAITDIGGNPIGTLTLNSDGSYTFDPDPNFIGSVPPIVYSVTDSAGESDQATLDITIEPKTIGISQQQIDATKNPDGTWNATFEMTIENTGDSPLTGFDLYNDVQTAWDNKFIGLETPTLDTSGMADPSEAPTLNTVWASDSSQNMLANDGTLAPGDTIVITYTATIHPDAGNTSEYLWSQAEVFADLPDTTEVSDLSDNGSSVNDAALIGPTLHDPTPVILPELAVAKTHLAPIPSGEHAALDMVDIQFHFYVENIGTVALTGISLEENLQEHFGAAFVEITPAGAPIITAGTVPVVDRPTINPLWDGVTETNMFLGTDGQIEPGEYLLAQIIVTLDPAQATEVLYNQAFASATYDPTPGTPGDEVLVDDLSDSGTNPNSTNPTFYGDTGGLDDPTPVAFEPALFFNDVTIREYHTATFNLRMDRTSTEDIELEIFTTDETATGGIDFRNVQFKWYNYIDNVWMDAVDGNKVTMFAGQQLIRVQVVGQGDNLVEPDETFTISANVLSGTVQEVVPGTGTLTDWSPQASIMIGDAIAQEGEGLVFDLELTAPSVSDEVFELTTIDDTATGGVDFETLDFEYSTDGGATWLPVAADNRVTFTPGETRMKVRVDTTEDAIDELDESFTLSGTMIDSIYFTRTEGTGTIIDNDGAPSLRFDDTMAEEGTPLTFDLTLSEPATEPIVLDLAAVPHDTLEPADAGIDYESTDFEYSTDGGLTWLPAVGGSQVTIPTGSSGIQVRIDTMEDALDELNEHFTLSPTVVSGQVGSIRPGVGKILDNEFAPILSVTDVTVIEGTDTYAQFSVDLSHLTSQDVLLNLSLIDQTATGTGTDFGSLGSDNLQVSYDDGATWIDATTATIPAGEDGFLVRTPVVDDADLEADETFDLRVTMNTDILNNGVPIANNIATGVATIIDDESDPTLTITDVTVSEGTDTHAVFTLDISRPSPGDLTLDLTLTDNTALGAGSDYGSAAADNLQISTDGGTTWVDATSVTIPAGQTSVMARTPIADDDLDESDETFTLTATVTAGAAQNPSAVAGVTILDDDYAAIGVAKEQVSAVRNADGSWNVAFDIVVQNTGSVPLSGIELFDDMATQLGEAYLSVSDLTLDASGMADPAQAPSLNAAWTGDTSLDMLGGDGTIAVGDLLTLHYTLTIDPDAIDKTSDYELNQAEVRADSPGGVVIVDQSDNGSDPDGYNTGEDTGRLSYFPFYDPQHTKMLVVENGTSGLGNGSIEIPFDVAGLERNLELGIFDGDSSNTWDNSDAELTYTLYADPNGDGIGMTAVETLHGNDMTNNAWDDYTHTNFDEALGPDGNYHYRMVAEFTDPATVNGHSAFQVRVNGGFAVDTGSIAYQTTAGGYGGYTSIFPNFHFEGYPFNEDPAIVTTYDGIWDFNIYVPEGTTTVDIWDGDFDFGSYDGTVFDTDDPNTPDGFIPAWNPAGSDVIPEGVAVAYPYDDNLSPIFRRSPSVQYELIAPDGTRYLNADPSGNQEWELFSVSSDPFDPAVMDYHADTIPAGVWQIHIVGLDLGNMNGFYTDFPMVGTDEDGNPVIPLSLDSVSEDDPTPIIIPDISPTLENTAVVPSVLGGNQYDVTMRVVVENIGTVDLENLTLDNDIAAQFGDVFTSITPGGEPVLVLADSTATILPTLDAAWDGDTSTAIFTGVDGFLKPGEYVTIEYTVTVDADVANSILYNQVQSGGMYDPTPGTPGDELSALDLSDSGFDPNTSNPGEPNDSGGIDDPTPLVLPPLPPIARDDLNTVTEDTTTNPISGNVLVNDTDPNGDPITVTFINGTPIPNGGSTTIVGQYGTVELFSDGSYVYTLNNDNPDVDALADLDSLLESFTYTIDDGNGGTDQADLNITIQGKNDPPSIISPIPDQNSLDGETITVDVSGNFSDPDSTIVYSATGLPPGLSIDPATGIISGTIDIDACLGGPYEVTITVDTDDGTVDSVYTWDVTNPVPTASDDSATTDEDTPISGNLLPNDTDPEGDPLSITEINGISYTPGDTITLPSGAILTVQPDGSYSYDPNGQYEDMSPGESAIDSFTYTIDDGNGGTDTATVIVTIAGLNDPPVAVDDSVETTYDQPITVPVLVNDFDPEDDPLTVIILQQPDSGTATLNPDGTITYVPEEFFEGTVTIPYLIEDPYGGTDQAVLTITVAPPFAFDHFHNFSKPDGHGDSGPDTILGSDHYLPYRATLSHEIFTLAPEPIFSGYARPGTQIIGHIYDESGTLIGEADAWSDPGGNWMMLFHGVKGHRFHRVEFEETQDDSGLYGYLGLNPADHSYQAMQQMTTYDKSLRVSTVIANTPEVALETMHRQNTTPLGFGCD